MVRFFGTDIKDGPNKAKPLTGFGFVCFLMLISLSTASIAHAQFDNKRQQERKSNRWTLADWLDTKKQMSSQNSWLSSHVNKIAIDGAFSFRQTPSRAGGAFDFYMKFLGFRLKHSRNVAYLPSGLRPDVLGPRSQIDLQLRLFGNNIQDTNIVLRGGAGYDQVQGLSGFNADYLGWGIEPEVQIYFAKFLGVWGSWRYRFASRPAESRNLELSGNSWQTAAFIEMNALRIEVGYQSRDWQFRNIHTSATQSLSTESIFGGLRLFY